MDAELFHIWCFPLGVVTLRALRRVRGDLRFRVFDHPEGDQLRQDAQPRSYRGRRSSAILHGERLMHHIGWTQSSIQADAYLVPRC